ncbi:MAG: prepilin-type N-terminal cleavage/methylation domain-containing protein [Candidatus Viridilinea halotolerans]|uniref:Prepilin-type N-terminal cleavage/methylation domain-containing protein n=1 Tax=Candidatus Viridilinea halotolerans TaxID=2491704 RepID=A0A426TTK8_9CHLR|nr:MAG: prepilin-type N-terminal cleavage/methylation domain-containing protein [Candidatus Viridilinea halotolerans]
MNFAWISLPECLVVLLVISIVAAFSFRVGFFRGKND